jgi:hypothetical protein
MEARGLGNERPPEVIDVRLVSLGDTYAIK